MIRNPLGPLQGK